MEKNLIVHHLLILSEDHEVYTRLIGQSELPGLIINGASKPEQVADTAGEYDLVFGEPALISTIINRLPQVEWVQASWAGVEPLLARGIQRNYILTNARDVYGRLMSEYVFGYLVIIERQALSRWQAQKGRKWANETPGTLRGKNFGLLGVGSIGSHLAATAHYFGMKVSGYTRQSEICADVDRYFHGNTWRDFTADLDYLVCTLPSTNATRNLVNADFLASLPARAWLINIGRGSTVDEMALINNLRNGSLAGAVLDVTKVEPLPAYHPLWHTPNTLLTFHTAARNYPADIAALFTENYRRFIHGEPLNFQVNFELGY
jgi:phosphoglycerate dehydrogenase-like enzyme